MFASKTYELRIAIVKGKRPYAIWGSCGKSSLGETFCFPVLHTSLLPECNLHVESNKAWKVGRSEPY